MISPMNALAARILAECRNAVSGPTAPLVLSATLVVAIAWLAAMLTWRMVEPPAVTPDTSIPAAASTMHGNDGESADIASLHLFGETDAEDRATSNSGPADAPDTRLNLRLTGLFAAGEGDGIAIIVPGNEDESIFVVGDRVAGEARVDGIYPDRVILERNGRLETLRLSKDGASTDSAATQARRASGNREIQRIARKADELRQRLIRNPLELARMVRFQPYMRDGELIGYRIQPRAADAELLSELGLRPTDVVTEVNGTSLGDPARAQEVLQEMRTAETISVTWLRDGKEHRMTVPIGSGQ